MVFIVGMPLKKLTITMAFGIPENACRTGFYLPHSGDIIINSLTNKAKNYKIHSGITIGLSEEKSKSSYLQALLC